LRDIFEGEVPVVDKIGFEELKYIPCGRDFDEPKENAEAGIMFSFPGGESWIALDVHKHARRDNKTRNVE
jgi:hypothetical protein